MSKKIQVKESQILSIIGDVIRENRKVIKVGNPQPPTPPMPAEGPMAAPDPMGQTGDFGEPGTTEQAANSIRILTQALRLTRKPILNIIFSN